MKISETLYNIALFFNGELRSLRYYYVSRKKNFRRIEPSPTPLDIVIPVIAKDLKILPLALEGVRRCVTNTVSKIYIVAPEDPRIVDFCEKENLVFVPEASVLGYTPKAMNVVIGKGRENRSGWVFQQLLKLSGRIGENRYFVTLDADHILLRPHTFLSVDNKMVFYQSRESHKAYYRYIAAFMHQYPLSAFSYVAHKMIFDKEILRQLHREIETRWGRRWDCAIVDNLMKDERFDLSEFEMYGNYVPSSKKIGTYWHEKPMPPSQLLAYSELQEKYGKDFLSVTFPYYLEDKNIETSLAKQNQ